MLAVNTPVVCGYLTMLVMEGPVHERRLIELISEVEFNVLSLSPFFQLVCHGAVRLLLYERMLVGCHGYGEDSNFDDQGAVHVGFTALDS